MLVARKTGNVRWFGNARVMGLGVPFRGIGIWNPGKEGRCFSRFCLSSACFFMESEEMRFLTTDGPLVNPGELVSGPARNRLRSGLL